VWSSNFKNKFIGLKYLFHFTLLCFFSSIYFRIKYVFISQLLIKVGISLEILVQFSLLTSELCEFSHFKQILLSLFNVSTAFHDSIWYVYTVWHTFVSILAKKKSWNAFETSIKLNKIWLKWLNSHNFEVGGLNWTKVSKRD